MTQEKKRCVVFVIDRLGYHCGGCTTINYELCIALRQITNEDTAIIALVINCDANDRIEALENQLTEIGIRIKHHNIVSQKEIFSSSECKEICESVEYIAGEESEKIWVGHDIFTGDYAIQLAEYSNSMSVVCIHTDYDTVEGLKGVNRDGIIKENKQRKIIKSANKIFAVGPRLMERVREVRTENIYELIPGLFCFGNNDVYNERAIISYGRFEGNIAQVKQTQLVFAAFGRAVKLMNNNKDYILHIIGSPSFEENKRLRDLAEKYAGRKLSIHFMEYIQDRQLLFECIKNNCAGLMISLSEGFGLTGWEMISVGIPLIFTKKSGLYDYMDNKFGYLLNGMCLPVDLKGSSLGGICEEDVQAVAEKILIVLKQPQKLRMVAEELREKLNKETWQNTASNFARSLGFSSSEYGTKDIYSETYKARKYSIESILNQLEIDKIGKYYVIFFGGVSSKLCEERAISKISRWLERDTTRTVIFCYETGKAAVERARELDQKKLPLDGLPNNPIERMKKKEELVKASIEKYPKFVRSQIKFIKLESSPMTYTIIVDNDIYFTILLQTRSSESMTMKLRENSFEERRLIIESMEFIINQQKADVEIKELIRILQSLKAHQRKE